MRNILIFITYLIITFPVMAYLDPGFGSIIIQSLVVIGMQLLTDKPNVEVKWEASDIPQGLP